MKGKSSITVDSQHFTQRLSINIIAYFGRNVMMFMYIFRVCRSSRTEMGFI